MPPEFLFWKLKHTNKQTNKNTFCNLPKLQNQVWIRNLEEVLFHFRIAMKNLLSSVYPVEFLLYHPWSSACWSSSCKLCYCHTVTCPSEMQRDTAVLGVATSCPRNFMWVEASDLGVTLDNAGPSSLCTCGVTIIVPALAVRCRTE